MANDTRDDHGSYYPGAKVIVSGSGTSGTATDVSGKVDRVTIGEIGDTYTNKDIKEKINSLIHALAPVASCLAAMLCMSTAMAATKVFEDIPSNARVVVSEDDPVAMAAIPEVVGSATNAAVEATKTYADAAVAVEASNRANAVEDVLVRSKSYTDTATNAIAAKIPVIDLDPYATKSWVEAKGYVTSDALGGVATKEWIGDQGYLTLLEIAPYATIDWVLGKGYATASDINGLATKSELDALKRMYADTNGVTRLWSEDGLTMTDGTGVVWSVTWNVVTNWVSLTNGIVYRPTAPGVWIGDGIITNGEGAVGVGRIEYGRGMPERFAFGLDGGGSYAEAVAEGLYLDYSDAVAMLPDAFTGIVERAALYVPIARVVTNDVGYVANGTSSDSVDTNAVNDLIASATKGLATAADVESKADKATTLAGYGITDAMPLVEDVNGEKTAVTIGCRSGTVGPYSLANGNNVTASGQGSHADGLETVASGLYSHANGMFTEAFGPGSYAGGYMAGTLPSHRHAFVWSGIGYSTEKYLSNGEGTFNINPIGGPDGFYIGEKKLSKTISDGVAGKADTTNVYTKAEVDAKGYIKADTVTNVVERVRDLIYDEKLNITWRRVMYDGNLYYVAVTNANIVSEEE